MKYRTQPQEWWPLGLIVLIFVSLGVLYSVTTPIWESPDETGHFGNVWYIATHQELPKPGTFYTWHQSPLYHIIAAAVVSGVEMSEPGQWLRPNPNSPTRSGGEPNISLHSVRELAPYRDIPLAVRLARWVGLFFGGVTVVATYILAKRLFPDHYRWIALGAAGLVAFNPQFIFMSTAVQNDAPLAAGFALTMLPALSIVQGDHRARQFLWLGGLTGLTILFKQSGIVLVGVAGLVVVWAAWQGRRWRSLFRWGGWTALACLLVGGPMYLRNTVLYGDPFAYRIYKSLHPPVEPLSLGEITPEMLRTATVSMHQSFWGRFGWVSVNLPEAIYHLLWVIYPLALAGLAVWFWRGRKRWAVPNGGLPAILLLLVGIAAVWAFVIRYMMLFGAFGVQGRYLFQMISAQSVLVSLGLYSLLPGRGRALPILATLLGLLALAVWAPFQVIAPAYTYLGDSPDVLETVQVKRGEVFGEAIQLAGYNAHLDRQTGRMEVTLYWQVLETPADDYTIFVHLLDETGQRHSQADKRPLDGAFPTNLWRTGDLLRTRHRLAAPEQCRQSACYLAVGFYEVESLERLAVTRGQATFNAVLLTDFAR